MDETPRSHINHGLLRLEGRRRPSRLEETRNFILKKRETAKCAGEESIDRRETTKINWEVRQVELAAMVTRKAVWETDT